MIRRKKTINFMIVLIVLSALVPAILFGIFTYGLMYKYIKNNILAAQQTALAHYTAQIDSALENLDSYILNLLYNKDWGELFRDKGDYKYENLKVVLAKDLQLKVEEDGSGKADAIGCYLKHSDEYIFAYSGIPYYESQILQKWEQKQCIQDWSLVGVEGENYLYKKYENATMSVGLLVKKESVIDSWNNTSEFLMSFGDRLDDKNNYLLNSELKNGNISLTIQVPYLYIQNAMPSQTMLMFITIIVWVLVTFLLLHLLKYYITRPLESMAGIIQRIKDGEKELRIPGGDKIHEIEAIEVSFNELMNQIYHLEIYNYKMEIENQKAQLMNLQLQINPHMLLNALNTVYGLAEIEEYKNIQIFTMNLVKYFRYSLKSIDTLVTLEQELDFIKSYIEMQKIRYPDLFYVVYNVEEELLDENIPPFIIENFVENSIKYALGSDVVEILVIVTRQEGKLQISICDDGLGIEETVLEELKKESYFERDGETHVGIYNCIRRLRLFYGEDMKYSITSHLNEGTQVWIEIPSRKEDV